MSARRKSDGRTAFFLSPAERAQICSLIYVRQAILSGGGDGDMYADRGRNPTQTRKDAWEAHESLGKLLKRLQEWKP